MNSDIADIDRLRDFETSLARGGASGYDYWIKLDDKIATVDLLINLLNIEFEHRICDPQRIPEMLSAIKAAGGDRSDVEELLSDLFEQIVDRGVRPTLKMFQLVCEEYWPSLKLSSDPCHLGEVVDGRFRVEERVGHGGFGVVYGVRSIETNERRAMKAPHRTDDENVQQMQAIQLKTEWLAMDWLAGRGCPRGCELSRTVHLSFITMDFVDGSSLREILRKGAVDIQASLEIVLSVARSVANAHSQGYIHRDLKPENILIDKQGEVFIVDFGLVATVPAGSRRTKLTIVGGTKDYMVPSNRSKLKCKFSARDDLYAIGVILHEMLCGFRPAIIPASSDDEMRDYVARLTLPDSVPEPLTRIVMKCVTSNETDWYADADELAEDVRSLLAGS